MKIIALLKQLVKNINFINHLELVLVVLHTYILCTYTSRTTLLLLATTRPPQSSSSSGSSSTSSYCDTNVLGEYIYINHQNKDFVKFNSIHTNLF